MATLPPSPFTALPASSAETLVVVSGPQAPTAAASGPFDSGVFSALSSDEAAASPSSPDAAADIPEPTSSTGGPQESPASGQELIGAGDLEANIPADEQRYPPGCPDAEWCRGNRLCYWHCNADPDEISNIGEIFAGARKLEQIPGIFDQAAITGSDELLYVTLKLMDDPHTRDLPDVPQGLIDAMEPLPLFLQQASA